MDSELRAAEHSGDALKRAVQLQRAGRLEECADTLERAWLAGDVSCGDALFQYLDGWRVEHAVAVASRLDRLACGGHERARAAWKRWFPELGAIVGTSENMRGLRRVVLEHAAGPCDSVLILNGTDGVGKSTAARVLQKLTKGPDLLLCDIWNLKELPPANGTVYVDAFQTGPWEEHYVRDCRARRARLVVGYPFAEPRWQTLHALDHVDYFITPLDQRREDVPALILERFPDWLLGRRDDPDFEHVKTIRVTPEAIAELSTRSWEGLNVRGLLFALRFAAWRAVRRSSTSEALTIGAEHLARGDSA